MTAVVLLALALLAAAPHTRSARAATPHPSVAATTSAATVPPTTQAGVPGAPPTAREVVRDTLHGTVIEDPYRWLEDQDAPRTREWIAAQNAFTDSVLARIPGRKTIADRLQQLIAVETATVPSERGGRYFFTRRRPDHDLSVLLLRRGAAGRDETLLDPDTLSQDHSLSVSYFGFTPDGRRVALATRKGGEDEITISFMDVDTRRMLPDVLPRARYFNGPALTAQGVYYVRYDQNGPRLKYHRWGADVATDAVVFGEGYGRDRVMNMAPSDDGRRLMLVEATGAAGSKTEVYVKDVAPAAPMRPIVTGLDATSTPQLHGDRIYLRTDWQAPNGRILAIDLAHPERDKWQEVVKQGDAPIRDHAVVGNALYVSTLDHVVAKLRRYDLDGTARGEVLLPGMGTLSELRGAPSGRELFFMFSSYDRPPVIHRLDTGTGKLTDWWAVKVPFDGTKYVVEQVWFPSKDGTKVPMFLAHRRDFVKDGSHPLYLTGYGGFDQSTLPAWNSSTALFLEHDGVWAAVNLRGGGEFGEAWHQAGMLANKQNVFDDLIGAAEWLVANGYTTSRRLAIGGTSNGGLLVGAALTQRPDLFRVVYCGFPLIDMLRYDQFLVGRFWVTEYGTAQDAAQFPALYAYSPYQHVTAGTKYPAVLFTTGDSDTRVAPLHARKMTALLQYASGSGQPVLLRYDTALGHSREGKPVSAQVKDDTDRNLFLFWQLGIIGLPGETPEPAVTQHR